MRLFLLFGIDGDKPPTRVVEAPAYERHGVTYTLYQGRFYRLREWTGAGLHTYIKGERVKVSLVEDDC